MSDRIPPPRVPRYGKDVNNSDYMFGVVMLVVAFVVVVGLALVGLHIFWWRHL
jgi:hypothetical protein